MPASIVYMSDYRTEAPQILRDFLSYHETIKAHSRRTVDEYFLALRNFFRYLKQTRNPALADKSLDEIDIMDVDALRAARENPQAYKSLSVRVSGWNARFVTLNEEWQNMVIERTARGM